MKKITSILLVILLIGGILHISVATHFCGGKDIASLVSVTGKLANCGMEESGYVQPYSGCNLSKHCCDDIVRFCGTDSNYLPTYSCVQESFQNNFQVCTIPVKLSGEFLLCSMPVFTDVSPPGAFMSTSVDLSDICVFRI